MAHQLDIINGKATMAYVGQTPWHGLGQQLEAGTDINIWRRESGLDYSVLSADTMYRVTDPEGNESYRDFPGRKTLFRSDTQTPLSVVSKDYKVVQPEEVLKFFSDLSDIGGFHLETVGALKGGLKIWGLAKIDDGAPIVDGDIVKPYVLLATSYDGTLATTARLTSIRVVCNNTLSRAYSSDTSSVVKVRHDAVFNPESVRRGLGIFSNQWEKFQIEMRRLAETKIQPDFADEFIAMLFARRASKRPDGTFPDVRQSKGYKEVMALFNGGQRGHEMVKGTAWGLVNAVTEWVDHSRGRTPETRLDAAWFGAGNDIKTTAFTRMLEVIS